MTSATIPSFSTVRVPCLFPVDNRRIHVAPIASMTAKTKATEYPKMAYAVSKVIERHPDERILVHTVSYDLARYLLRVLYTELGPAKSRLLMYESANDRDKIVERYREREGSVLLAPSLERGVDFKGDDCRVVVVAKIPFPNLGDRQVNARLHSPGGPLWYSVQTVRSLVQMTGRGVRSETDWAESYVLDRQFTDNVWKKSRALLPAWWVEALDMTATHVKEFSGSFTGAHAQVEHHTRQRGGAHG